MSQDQNLKNNVQLKDRTLQYSLFRIRNVGKKYSISRKFQVEFDLTRVLTARFNQQRFKVRFQRLTRTKTNLSIKNTSSNLLIFFFPLLEALAPSVFQTLLPIGRFEVVIFDAARIALQDRSSRFLAEDDVVFDVFLKLDVWDSRVFRLVDHDALSGRFDVVVHSEVGGAPMH